MPKADLKQLKVNQGLCIGCGTCAALMPEVFVLGQNGKAKVVITNKVVTEEEIDNVIQSCPTQAISYKK